MITRVHLAVLLACSWLAVLVFASTSQASDAIYVWRDPRRAGSPIPDPAAAMDLARFCVHRGITDIHYDNWGDGTLNPGSGRQDVPPNDALLAAFISSAHSLGLRVSALYTDNVRFANALAYNASRPPAERFDGIHMDYEPSPEPSDSAAIYYYRQAKNRAAPLPLSVSISHHWDTLVRYEGSTKPAYQHITDIVDALDVQTVQDCSDVIEQVSKEEVCYATQTARPICVTIETSDRVANEFNTYREEGESGGVGLPCGQRGMETDLPEISYVGVCGGGSGTPEGFAFHFYRNSFGSGAPGWPTHAGSLGARANVSIVAAGDTVYGVWEEDGVVAYATVTGPDGPFPPAHQYLGTGVAPQLWLDGPGRVHATWARQRSADDTVSYARSASAGGPITGAVALGLGRNPYVAGSTDGQWVYVVYHRVVEGVEVAFCRRSSNGGNSFEGEVQVTDPGFSRGITPEFGRGLAVSPDGHQVHVVFRGMSGVYWLVYYQRSDDFGASFGPAQNLHIPPHATYAPSVAAFGNRVHVLLKRDNYGSDQIWMWTSTDSGATWSDPVRVDDGATRYPSGTILDYVNPAEVVVHGDGSITVAFVDNTPGDALVLLDRSVDDGMTFRRDARVDDAPPGVDSVNPSLAGGTGTNVVVAWEDDRTGQTDIYFRRLDAVLVAVPPVDAQPTLMRIQARPNPFRAGTVLAYTLPSEGHVLLDVLDVTGRSVRTLVDKVQAAGAHLVDWNGLEGSKRSASAGVYWIRLRSAGTMRACKVVFVP